MLNPEELKEKEREKYIHEYNKSFKPFISGSVIIVFFLIVYTWISPSINPLSSIKSKIFGEGRKCCVYLEKCYDVDVLAVYTISKMNNHFENNYYYISDMNNDRAKFLKYLEQFNKSEKDYKRIEKIYVKKIELFIDLLEYTIINYEKLYEDEFIHKLNTYYDILAQTEDEKTEETINLLKKKGIKYKINNSGNLEYKCTSYKFKI